MAFKIQNNRSRKREPMSEINVTPFVDVMLVLLIIFIVILLEIKKQLNKGSNFINNIFGN